MRDLIPADDRIHLINIEEGYLIGAKRNYGCELARGEIIAHWDDDDWSSPGRLADQVQRLTETGKAVTGYRTMCFSDGSHWWLYEGVPSFALGTSLCYRKDWWRSHPFNTVQVGEDGAFVTAAQNERQIAVIEAGGRMFATVHCGNTSPRNLHGNTSYRFLGDEEVPAELMGAR